MRCNMNRTSWRYTEDISYSVVTEFDLVCSKDPWSHLANSGLFIGQILGSFVFGWLSDRYGRRTILFPCCLLNITLALLTSFAPNVATFIVLRILLGVFHGGVVLTAVVMSVELVGPKYRAFGGLIMWQSWTIATCLMSLQSYYIKSWRTLAIVISAPYFIVCFAIKFIPESVRWQRSKNKLEEAEKTLRRIAASNNKVFPVNCQISPVKKETVNKGSYKDLVSTWNAFSKTMKLTIMWYTNDFLYYGISMAAGDLGGNLHQDFVLITVFEIPASLSTIYIIDRIGRRKGALLGYGVTCIAMFTLAFMQAYQINIFELRVFLGITSKVFCLISWCACSVWTSELFPTSMRAQAVGIFTIIAQCGAASAPWISLWIKKFYLPLPFIIFGTSLILAGLAAFCLPETLGKKIIDVIENEKNGKELEMQVNEKELVGHDEKQDSNNML